ncbi:MAG TPA: glycosyltransferase family 2 protein [Candidatus Competibacteraceae bacterium]|nr:glycosyltransferase family 2 protein [Candidatus Competibacteraceae bacterium]HPF59836.1 glycosyltransferase family 2 protein [Candidatus Competibacteraceae bacterium]
MTVCSQKNISVVIPVFRNQETIEETCLQIFNVYQQTFSQHELEIVLVDDGSDDDSYKKLLSIYERYPEKIVIVKLSRNFGQLFAILAGYSIARGDAIITISADLQDPVSLMADMVAHWEQGNEIVVAYRQGREDDIAARLFSKAAYSVAKKANPNMPSGGFDYLLLSRKAVDLLKAFHGRHRFFQGDVLWLGLKTVFIPYIRKKRKFGKSGWSFSRKIKYFIDLILDSSYLPIRLMSAVGVITALTGCVYAIAIVYAWLVNQTPFQGWAPLMIIVLLVGGMIMTMLGVIGEYLWRIYDDVRERPMYVIDKIICDETQTKIK